MATRGAIARLVSQEPLCFRGRYHHWDSYPSGLGQTLWALYHGHFQRDLEAMLKFLIDDHPAGWSSINIADFSLDPGFHDPLFDHDPLSNGDEPRGPVCYCHGERREEPWEVTEQNAAGSGCEYVYAFTAEQIMVVLSSYTKTGKKMIGMFGMGDSKAAWKIIATVGLRGDEPNWAAMEGHTIANLKQSHLHRNGPAGG